MSAIFEKIIPKQRKMSTRIGGLLIIVGETMFLFSLLNFLMITRLQYYSSGDSFMRVLFPHYLLFLAALFVVAFIGMWLTYVYVFPSKQRFSQEQAIKDDRSPMYNKILDLEDDIDELKKVVFDMSEEIDRMNQKDNIQ
jgi:predicted membrane protein